MEFGWGWKAFWIISVAILIASGIPNGTESRPRRVGGGVAAP